MSATDDSPMNQGIPAKYTYIAFLDLLADALFQHQMAENEANSYMASRLSRASIIASSLSVECFANCLLALLPSRKLSKDIDKLPPLSKIDLSLRLKQFLEIDRGRLEVQQVADLMKARNDVVHSKRVAIQASMDLPRDAGNEWMFPITMSGEHWRGLGIPKQAMFWSKKDSFKTLSVISSFYRYVLVGLMQADEEMISKVLISRAELGNVLMPGVYDEFRDLLASASRLGVDFSFLGINRSDN